MLSPDDRRAVLLLLGLAGAGLVVRVLGGGAVAPGAVWYGPDRGATRPVKDSVTAAAARLARPLAAGETIDVNRASAADLARLPGIGPGLAARIIADRQARGPFGSPDELARVSGIGPKTVERVRRHVTGTAGDRAFGTALEARGTVILSTATVQELAQLPGIGPRFARAIVEDRRLRGPYTRVDDLLRIRGIGPATVDRIRGRVSP